MKDELFIFCWCPKCNGEEIEILSDGSLYCRYCDYCIEGIKAMIEEPGLDYEDLD